jgi:hypothetical protein
MGVSSAGVRGAKHVRGYRRVGPGNGPARERAFADFAKPALARHLDGDGENQARHAALYRRIGYAVLEKICHALGHAPTHGRE